MDAQSGGLKKQKEENKLKADPRNAYVSSQQVLLLPSPPPN
jgi:hypothetical protein